MPDVAIAKFESFEKTLPAVLDRLDLKETISNKQKIVIKPNLIINKPYPITTDPKLVEELIKYIRRCSKAKIIIAEGSGGDTMENFEQLGYIELAKKYKLTLIDLNECEVVELKNNNAKYLKKFYFPKPILDSFLISVACLKHHHATKVTLSLKNMFGIAPGKYYSHNVRGKPWSKETFHDLGLEQCIVDINLYKKPDLAIIDGRIAQLETEQAGPTKRIGLLFAGEPIIVDFIAARYLGYDSVPYIEELAKKFDIDLKKIEIEKI